MQDFIRRVWRALCCVPLGLLVVGLGSSLFAANAEARSFPRESTKCTAMGAATAWAPVHPHVPASAPDQQTAQAQAADATGCSLVGSWVDTISDGAGNSETCTLGNAGNRVGERKDRGGTLTRNITRAFDGLNQRKGAAGAAP